MCPWNLLKDSNSFTTYLSAYSVFLSSIAGVIICDYYFVRKGYLELKNLYSANSKSPYFYWFGWSWRGYTAYIAGILINIVGFVGAIGKPIPKGAAYIYNVNFFAGFIVASLTYYLLCRFFPIPAVSDVWFEQPDAADRRFSAAYTAGEGYDEERSSGSDHGVYSKEAEAMGVREKSTAVHDKVTVEKAY
jgi:nucleobase:cation symporter-1, NCS1 family